jgi:hypothetical protein
MTKTAIMPRPKPPSNAYSILPDSPDGRYKCRYEIRSETSDRIYRISFDAAKGAGYWVCSCPGCISHGSCKHLESAGLRGRKYGRQLDTLKAFGLA